MRFHNEDSNRLKDRDRRAANEEWEIIYLRQKFGLSESEIKIAKANYGNSSEAIETYLLQQKPKTYFK